MPVIDVSLLKALPRENLITEVVHSTDKKLLIILNKILSQQEPQRFSNFDFDAPRYILHLQDQTLRQQIFILQQGILWLDENRGNAFRIGGNLWQHLEKLFKNLPMSIAKSANEKIS